jgi:hypothetical protein
LADGRGSESRWAATRSQGISTLADEISESKHSLRAVSPQPLCNRGIPRAGHDRSRVRAPSLEPLRKSALGETTAKTPTEIHAENP